MPNYLPTAGERAVRANYVRNVVDQHEQRIAQNGQGVNSASAGHGLDSRAIGRNAPVPSPSAAPTLPQSHRIPSIPTASQSHPGVYSTNMNHGLNPQATRRHTAVPPQPAAAQESLYLGSHSHRAAGILAAVTQGSRDVDNNNRNVGCDPRAIRRYGIMASSPSPGPRETQQHQPHVHRVAGDPRVAQGPRPVHHKTMPPPSANSGHIKQAQTHYRHAAAEEERHRHAVERDRRRRAAQLERQRRAARKAKFRSEPPFVFACGSPPIALACTPPELPPNHRYMTLFEVRNWQANRHHEKMRKTRDDRSAMAILANGQQEKPLQKGMEERVTATSKDGDNTSPSM
ncbi:hypothetical protein GGR57DRAFT_455439 [Xylariaceae sp. FL1272]|nr:hypothetical protein GGR57DRAFT_455439 [Xylariaceae sp. FL1272]